MSMASNFCGLMQEVKKEALALSRYFVSLPHPAKTTILIVIVSFIFGLLFALARDQGAGLVGILAGGVDGLFLLAFPAFLSSLGLFLVRRKAVFRRAVFLGLLSALVYGIFYLASFALFGIWESAENLLFIGFGFAFVLWYFMLFLAFDFRKSAFVFATMQLVIFSIFFLAAGGIGAGTDPAGLIVKVYLASFVLLAALYVLFYLISAPMKKNLGISSMDALSMFLSQWLYGEKDLEEAFEEIGEEVETLVWVANLKGRKNDVLFVVPYIHFGPFGNLGGSEFTGMIANALAGKKGEKKKEVFVFHGTATHDFNPVSSDEISQVVGACKRAIKKLKMKKAALSYSCCQVGTVRAQAYQINDSAFLSYTRAPKTTEDVNLGIGLALMEKAKRYCKSACIVDEHNAETGDISSVEIGNPIGFDMLDATEKLLSEKHKKKNFLFGAASSSIELDTVGKNGLKLALFAQGKKMNAILLADSNGIVPKFRETLLELFEGLGKECGYECKGEIMTTDTHQINTVRGALNPLGTENCNDMAMEIRKLFFEAKEKLEKVSFDSAEERFGIKVFGIGQSAEIASTINAVVSILRLALPLIIIISAVLLLWALGRL